MKVKCKYVDCDLVFVSEKKMLNHQRIHNTKVFNWDFAMAWHNPYLEYGLSNTLKIHIIRDHLGDRLCETGKTLLDESDEHTEQAHHRVTGFCNTHQYQTSNRQLGTPQQGKKQHKMIIHLNSNNI